MNRADEILKLRQRYAEAILRRKPKLASLIFARLLSLTTRQLKTENRQDRHEYRV